MSKSEIEIRGENMTNEELNGINLRDYFAGQALQSIIVNNDLYRQTVCDEYIAKSPKDRVAKAAYAYADAMMKARGG